MVVVHPLALDEMARAINHYATVSESIATRFAEELDATLDEVQSIPLRWGYYEPLIEHRRWRRKKVLGFPYLLIYEMVGEQPRIVAFPHVGQRPGYWIDR